MNEVKTEWRKLLLTRDECGMLNKSLNVASLTSFQQKISSFYLSQEAVNKQGGK